MHAVDCSVQTYPGVFKRFSVLHGRLNERHCDTFQCLTFHILRLTGNTSDLAVVVLPKYGESLIKIRANAIPDFDLMHRSCEIFVYFLFGLGKKTKKQKTQTKTKNTKTNPKTNKKTHTNNSNNKTNNNTQSKINTHKNIQTTTNKQKTKTSFQTRLNNMVVLGAKINTPKNKQI